MCVCRGGVGWGVCPFSSLFTITVVQIHENDIKKSVHLCVCLSTSVCVCALLLNSVKHKILIRFRYPTQNQNLNLTKMQVSLNTNGKYANISVSQAFCGSVKIYATGVPLCFEFKPFRVHQCWSNEEQKRVLMT